MRVADKLKNAGSPISNSEKLSLNMKEPSQYCLLGYSKGGTVMQEGNVPWLHTQAHKTTSYVQKLCRIQQNLWQYWDGHCTAYLAVFYRVCDFSRWGLNAEIEHAAPEGKAPGEKVKA